jgi:hypothetical protein
MIPGFSVKFVINRLTANYKIQITDTTDYSGVSTAYGFYRIEYPDGLYQENTDALNPDFEIGQNFTELTFRMKNFVPMAGQYRIIQKTYADTGDVETTKTITFSFVEPTLKLSNTSNLAEPSVSFTDATDYNLGFYTESISKVLSSNFPSTLPFSGELVTTTSDVLDMVRSGSYYEGIYTPSISVAVVFTGTDHVIEWSKTASFTFDIRKILNYSDILQYLDITKSRYDQAKGSTNESKERENYQLVASLVDHIQLKAASVSPGISSLMLEIQDLIYKITCSYTDNYDYSVDPLPPIDSEFFTEGVPLNRVLTINGVAQDLTQDRVWNVGTVTSVDIQVPTWMTVVGGPITESGTFQLGLAAGYYIPTTVDVARWDVDTYVTAVSVSGTLTKTISITRNDGVVLTAQWNDIDTFPVTSVNGKTGDVVLVTDDIQEDASPVNLWFTQARARASVSLTTIGNSGPATYTQATGVFNIPNYTLAGLGGVPLTRTLTINGVSFDLSADRTWNVGTVTSVAVQVPTWMTVTGSPITQSGTFILGLAAGYYIPTTTDKTEWDIAYDKHVTAISVSGTSTKTITLTRNDGTTLVATFNDIDTFPVTSVNGKTGAVVLVTDDIAEDASPVNLWFTQARARASVSLTTIGNSGPATYTQATGVFNVPNYTLAGLGGVPLTRNITINGQTFDLSGDRVFTVDIGVASATGTAPITVTPSTGNIVVSHDDSTVVPGTYNKVTVDQKGHITLGENDADQNNFVRVLRIPNYMIDFNNDIKVEIANYINQMNPPLNIDETDSKWNIVIEYSVPDLLDANTEINIWFDNSGSMTNVLEPLINALTSCLKSLLLPIYGTVALYEERVKVYSFIPGSFTVNGQPISLPSKSSGANERTFVVLNTMGSSDSITRVINIVFQDEAQDVYHQVPYDGTITQGYIDDLAALKAELALKKDPNYYKGVIYQIANPTFQGAFGDLLQEAVAGTGNFSGVNSLADLTSAGKLSIEYNIFQSNDSFFYLNLLRNTLLGLGFTNVGSTESLVCFVPITGLISVACNDFSGTNGFIDVGGLSGGSGSGYYFTLNGGATQYTPGVGATGLADGSYAVRVFDDEGNNYLLNTINLSCFTELSGQTTSACSGATNGSGSIDVVNVTGGSGSGYYFTLNGGLVQYTPGTGVSGLNDGSYLVTLYDGAGTSISLGTVNIACVQTYNINVYLCGTCTQTGTAAIEYNPAFPLVIGKFYRLTNGNVAQITGLSNFSVTPGIAIADSLTYYNSCAEVPCA